MTTTVRRALLPLAVVAALAAPPLRAGDPKPAKPGGAPAASAANAPARPAPTPLPRSLEEALRLLDARRLSVQFDDVPLPDAVRHLATLTGMNILVGPALLRDGGADLRVRMRLRDVTARAAMEFLVESGGLGLRVERGILLVTTRKDALGRPVLRLYSVASLTMPIRDFPAPDLMLRPAGSERVVEEETPVKPAFSDADDILALIKDTTGAGTWADDGISASVMRDWIVVKQYPGVQREIARLLDLLRASR